MNSDTLRLQAEARLRKALEDRDQTERAVTFPPCEMQERDPDSPDAMRFNAGKPKWHLLPLWLLEPVVEVLEYGAKKYAPYNWMKGGDVSTPLDSMTRHCVSLQCGEWVDSESGLPHAAHIAVNALQILCWYKERKARSGGVRGWEWIDQMHSDTTT
jgi:hypothetical protein